MRRKMEDLMPRKPRVLHKQHPIGPFWFFSANSPNAASRSDHSRTLTRRTIALPRLRTRRNTSKPGGRYSGPRTRSNRSCCFSQKLVLRETLEFKMLSSTGASLLELPENDFIFVEKSLSVDQLFDTLGNSSIFPKALHGSFVRKGVQAHEKKAQRRSGSAGDQ